MQYKGYEFKVEFFQCSENSEPKICKLTKDKFALECFLLEFKEILSNLIIQRNDLINFICPRGEYYTFSYDGKIIDYKTITICLKIIEQPNL